MAELRHWLRTWVVSLQSGAICQFNLSFQCRHDPRNNLLLRLQRKMRQNTALLCRNRATVPAPGWSKQCESFFCAGDSLRNRSRFGSFDCWGDEPRYSVQLIRNRAELEM